VSLDGVFDTCDTGLESNFRLSMNEFLTNFASASPPVDLENDSVESVLRIM